MARFETLDSLVQALSYRGLERKDFVRLTLKDEAFYYASLGVGLVATIGLVVLLTIVNMLPFIEVSRAFFMGSFACLPAGFAITFKQFLESKEYYFPLEAKAAEKMVRDFPVLKEVLKDFEEAETYQEMRDAKDWYLDERFIIHKELVARRQRR